VPLPPLGTRLVSPRGCPDHNTPTFVAGERGAGGAALRDGGRVDTGASVGLFIVNKLKFSAQLCCTPLSGEGARLCWVAAAERSAQLGVEVCERHVLHGHQRRLCEFRGGHAVDLRELLVARAHWHHQPPTHL
jgi:hypothetical protein